MFGTWLRTLLGKDTPHACRREARPTLESLEERCVPTLTVAFNSSAATLARVIDGSGVKISNPSYTGSTLAAGTFKGGSAAVGLSSGIVLDTGMISDIPGPYTSDESSFITGTSVGEPGDNNLSNLGGNFTYDAAALTFNFVAQGPVVKLTFVFASNEFLAGSIPPSVNNDDIFAAILNGVPVNVPALGTAAVTPDNIEAAFGNVMIINDPTINANGLAPRSVKFNALTVPLTVTANVTPGTVNTIELGIADANDTINDSAVFIGAQSFAVGPRLIATYPTRYTFNPNSNTYDGFINVANVGSDPLVGQAMVTFTNLPPGVTVANASGVNASNQFYIFLPTTYLPPNSFVRIPVKLSNPLHEALPTYFNGQGMIVSFG